MRISVVVATAAWLLGACGPGAREPSADAATDAPIDAATDAPTDVADSEPTDAGPPPTTRDDAYRELRDSVRSLDLGWRFRPDPSDIGLSEGWAEAAHDDSDWERLDAGRTWEEQGHPDLDGVAWYRMRVSVPGDWGGSPVRLAAAGVDDEYDVYVNGELVRHFGEQPERSVFNWRTFSRLDRHLRFGEENVIAVRVRDWGGGGGLWRHVELRRAVPLGPYRHLLPAPVLADRPEWVDLYWEAWRMAWEKIAFGTADNGFVDAYMDEGFNEQVYQWDSSFMALFGRYGARLFPAIETLDNFYARQRTDGYIQRVYSETTGREVEVPSGEEPLLNPPLFAWVEWTWAEHSGDGSRLERVFPILERYWQWVHDHARDGAGGGLYFQTDLGSGMDNLPRGGALSGWVDMSAQQALAALMLANMARELGLGERAARWDGEHTRLAQLINDLCWNGDDGVYYDRTRDGGHAGVRHIGGFWPMLAGVADEAQTSSMVAALEDPTHFWRPHVFPTLAASDAGYVDHGHYWRGGVWAPTNYMVVKGLERGGHEALARRAAQNHLTNMSAVLESPPASELSVAPEERDGEYGTIWECYAPERPAPATRWDGRYLSRQDFVGWSGLGPIAMLIENIVGLHVHGASRTVTWDLTRTDRHGVERLDLAGDVVNLIAEERAGLDSPVRLRVATELGFRLIVRRPDQADEARLVAPGESTLEL